MYLQGVDSVYDLKWNDTITYGDVYHQQEVEQSTYNFEVADTSMLFDFFTKYESEALRIIEKGLVLPAYEFCLKCSHTFNLLDARGAISVTERTGVYRKDQKYCQSMFQSICGAAGGPWPSAFTTRSPG